MAARRGTKRDFVAYMMSHPGINVNLADLADDIGTTVPLLGQCATTVVRTEPELGITKIATNVYRYVPVSNTGPLFIQIGLTSTGRLLLEDEDGTVYLAAPVEIMPK